MAKLIVVVLCLAALVACAYAGADASCLSNCVNPYINCLSNAGNNPDDVCDCVSNLFECYNNCDIWCDLYGDYYDEWYTPYCGSGDYCGICKYFDDCDGNNNPSPNPSPSPSKPKYYYDLILCYYQEVGCALEQLFEALLVSSNNAVIEFYSDVCDQYDNYCEDVPDLFTKRGVTGTPRSVKVQFAGFETQDAATASLNSVLTDVTNGLSFGDGYVSAATEASCNDCADECEGCALSGKWSYTKEGDCVEFNNCPADEGEVNIKVKTTLQFDGDSQTGDDETLHITQKWEFSGSAFGDINTPAIDCDVTYGGEYRFYSNAATCSNRIDLHDILTCEHDCEDNILLDQDYKDMMCENFPVVSELDDVDFGDNCKTAQIQDVTYQRGSAGQLVPAVLAVFAAVALLF